MERHRFGMSLWLVLGAAGTAQADECRDILTSNMKDSLETVSKATANATERAFYCSSSYQESLDYYEDQKQKAQSGGLSIGYGPYSLGGNAASGTGSSKTKQSFDKWRSENCGSLSADDASSAYQYLSQQVVKKDVVENWRECMLGREGLSCWPERLGDTVYIRVNWKKNSTERAIVTSSFLSRGKSPSFAPNHANRLFISDYDLSPGDIHVPVTDLSTEDSMSASLTLRHGGTNHSCRVYVPGIIPGLEIAGVEEADSGPEETITVSSRRAECTARAGGEACEIFERVVMPDYYDYCSEELIVSTSPWPGAHASIQAIVNNVMLGVIVHADPPPSGTAEVGGRLNVKFVHFEVPDDRRQELGCVPQTALNVPTTWRRHLMDENSPFKTPVRNK